MIPINNFLGQIFPEQDWRFILLQQWETIVGNLKTRVTIEKITNNSLVVGVHDSSWMQELHLLSPLLLERINAHFTQPHIQSISFKLTPKKKKVQTTSFQRDITVKNARALTDKEQRALKTIQDPALQQALHNFLVRCLQEGT